MYCQNLTAYKRCTHYSVCQVDWCKYSLGKLDCHIPGKSSTDDILAGVWTHFMNYISWTTAQHTWKTDLSTGSVRKLSVVFQVQQRDSYKCLMVTSHITLYYPVFCYVCRVLPPNSTCSKASYNFICVILSGEFNYHMCKGCFQELH